MKTKQTKINKFLCSLLLVLCSLFLFFACPDPKTFDDEDEDDDNPYENPNAGTSRDLGFSFSHDSGLYSAQFNLTLTPVAEGRKIYYTTDGSIPSPGKTGTVEYTAPIVIKDRNNPMQANVLATPANHEQMYMFPTDPRGDVPQIYAGLTDEKVPKATVIRAMAVDENGKASDVATKTYFIDGNFSVYGNTRIISLVSDPVGLVSEATGIMVRGDPANRWSDTGHMYNFRRKGEQWERPAYLEIFEGDASSRSVKLSTGVGIRVRGGYSRGPGQKSFTVYFKEQYGINNLRASDYYLIPGAVRADGTPLQRFKGFMLRTGANDSEYGKYYDLFLQELLNDRSFSTQAGVPCIVYLNGEYWGPYNLQERYSDNHTEYKYGVDKDNVISYDNDELDDGNPGEETLYLDLVNGVINGTVTYEQFCAKFDIDNFIDYWAAEIYINNEDWPHNNYRVWRARNYDSAHLPYGDTKWRYQMFDIEFAMGLYSGSIRDPIDVILTGSHSNEHHNNKLFKKLLAEEAFCRQFVNTIMDLYNVNFHPSKFDSLLTSYANTYRPLMGDENTPGTYYSRWGLPWSSFNYQSKVDNARSYLNGIRNAMVNNYLPTYFNGGYSGVNSNVNIGSAYNVTLSATGVPGASIKINSITVPSGWTGEYFSGNPIPVTAIAVPGYEFDGWIVTGGTPATSDASSIDVTITGNAQIIAKYKQTGVAIVDATSITLNNTTLNLKLGQTANLSATFTPGNTTHKALLWSSNNEAVATVDGNGNVTAVSINGGSATITAKTLNGQTATCTVTVQNVTVYLDLADLIKNFSQQDINDWQAFNDVFTANDIPVSDNWIGTATTYKIIVEGTTRKIQVNELAMWGPGIHITRIATNFQFQVGDRIEVKGTHLSSSQSDGIQIQREYDDPYSTIFRWSISPGQDFQGTFILTEGDVYWLNKNLDTNGNAFRIGTNGKDPWKTPGDPGYITGYVGSFVIEQVRIYRP